MNNRKIGIFLAPSPFGPGMIKSPPLDIANLAAILNSTHIYDVELFDFRIHTILQDEFWQKLKGKISLFNDFQRCFNHLLGDNDPLISGFSQMILEKSGLTGLSTVIFSVSVLEQFSLQYLVTSLCIARELKNKFKDTRIVFFGNCPKAHVRKIMKKFVFIDAFLEDGNEYSLLEYLNNRKPGFAVEGVCFRDKEKLLFTDKKRPLRMEQFPLPDFSLFDLDAYRSHGKLVLPYEIGRGCINRCFFCYYIHKGGIAFKSAAKVANELGVLSKKYAADYFHFMDATINFSNKYLINLCNKLIKEGTRVKWSALAIPNIDPATLRLMKDCGCLQLRWGVEYGSDRLLKIIGKKTTLDTIRNALKCAHELGIYNYITLLTGLNIEKKSDHEITVNFLKENCRYIDAAKECVWGELGHFSILHLENLLKNRPCQAANNKKLFSKVLNGLGIPSSDIIEVLTEKKRISFVLVPNEEFPRVIKQGECGDEKTPHLEIFSSMSYLTNKIKDIETEYKNFPTLFSEKQEISSFLLRVADKNDRHAKMLDLIMKFLRKSDFFVFYIPLWSENIKLSSSLAKRIKLTFPSAKLIFFGPCCRLYPEEIIKDFPHIDFIITGEPEEALAGLITGKPIEEIPNIAHSSGNGVCLHRESGLNLSDPDYKLDYSAYFNFLKAYSLSRPAFLYFETSRGCKYNCFFCSLLTARNLRFKEVNTAVNEYKRIAEDTKIKYFYFVDNELNFNNRHLVKFIDKLIASKVKTYWSSYMVAKELDEEILKKMKAAGCIHIRWGIETVNSERQRMISKNLNSAEVASILRLSHQAGIKNQIAFTLGYPYDCQKDVNLINEFLEQNYKSLDVVNLYCFKPRRNSVIFNHPGKFGIEIINAQDSLWRDEVPFNEIEGLDWRLKKEQQASYLRSVNEKIKSLRLINIDPEVYFKHLVKVKNGT